MRHYLRMDKKKSLKTPNSSQGESGVVPENTVYETPGKIRKVQDKTGWKVLPENEMMMSGKLNAVKNNHLIPEGLDCPTTNKPTKGK